MFLVGDQVVVFSDVYIPRKIEGDHPICAPAWESRWDAYCGYWANDVTQITTVDVSNPSQPKITAEILLPGSYLSARRIDQRVRVVMSDTLPFPDGIRDWPDLPPGTTPEQRNKAFDELEAANEALIRSRSLEDWLRKGEVRNPRRSHHAHRLPVLGVLPQHGADRPGPAHRGHGGPHHRLAEEPDLVLAEPGTVHASKDTLLRRHLSLVVVGREIGQSDATYVHGFDLRDPDQAPYIGSGDRRRVRA
jgi:hypothetical protein